MDGKEREDEEAASIGAERDSVIELAPEMGSASVEEEAVAIYN